MLSDSKGSVMSDRKGSMMSDRKGSVMSDAKGRKCSFIEGAMSCRRGSFRRASNQSASGKSSPSATGSSCTPRRLSVLNFIRPPDPCGRRKTNSREIAEWREQQWGDLPIIKIGPSLLQFTNILKGEGAVAAKQAVADATEEGWRRRYVQCLNEGAAFCERGLLDCNSPGNHTIVAKENATVAWLDAADYAAILLELGHRGDLFERSTLQKSVELNYFESDLAISTFLATRAKLVGGQDPKASFKTRELVGGADGSFSEVVLTSNGQSTLIAAIASKIEMLSPHAGEELIRQGESAAGLFIVLRGHCNCYIDAPEETTGLRLVKVVHVGDHFGELSLLEPGVVTRAHVHAGQDTRVGLLVPDAFEEVCDTQ